MNRNKKAQIAGLLIIIYILVVWYMRPKVEPKVDVRKNEILLDKISDHYVLPIKEVVGEVIVEEPVVAEVVEKEVVVEKKEVVKEPLVEKPVVEKVAVEKVVEVQPEVTPEPTPVINPTNDDLYWLARIISAEARGESQKGQIAVGNVIMNRVKSDKFPNTIKGVVFQKGQFSPVSDGSINKEPYDICVDSAKKVLDGQVVVGSEVLYFYAPKYTASRSWSRTRTTISEIGNHRFTN